MNEIDTVQSPTLAMPSRPEGRLTLRQFLRVVRDNTLATYPPEAFDEDIIARRLLWRRRFIINEPNAIRHVLLDNAANYTKSELSRRLLEPALGRGLLTSEGETWRRHRRIMAPAFDHRSIIGYAPIVTEVTAGLVERWDALPDLGEIDVAAEMMHTTLHIISRAMFSSDSDDIVDVVERGVGEYQATMRPSLLDLLRFPVWLTRALSLRRAIGAFDEFDKSVDRLLSTRGREPNTEPRDLLARLIAARDSETGGGMTAKEVRDQVVTIFMAGHETSAQALAWTWYLLSLHPAVEMKLHDELSTVLHRKPSLWEHPDRFDPERFSPERVLARPRYAYIPFGAGQRICIGAAFAMTEAMLILAMIAQRYRLHLKPGHPIEPQGLITLRPRYGLRMTLERRQ